MEHQCPSPGVHDGDASRLSELHKLWQDDADAFELPGYPLLYLGEEDKQGNKTFIILLEGTGEGFRGSKRGAVTETAFWGWVYLMIYEKWPDAKTPVYLPLAVRVLMIKTKLGETQYLLSNCERSHELDPNRLLVVGVHEHVEMEAEDFELRSGMTREWKLLAEDGNREWVKRDRWWRPMLCRTGMSSAEWPQGRPKYWQATPD